VAGFAAGLISFNSLSFHQTSVIAHVSLLMLFAVANFADPATCSPRDLSRLSMLSSSPHVTLMQVIPRRVLMGMGQGAG